MSSFNKVLVVLCLLCTTAHTLGVQTFFRNYSEDIEPFYYRVSENIDQSFVYIMCMASDMNYYYCSSRLTMLNSDPKNCNFTITLPESQVLGYDFFSNSKLQSMYRDNKVVFEWTLNTREIRQHRWVGLLDMETCHYLQLHFPLNIISRDKLQHKERKSNYHVLAYGDIFNILVDSRAKCGKKRSPCMLGYNYTGELVSNITIPSKYFEEGHSMVVDRSNSSSGAYLTTFDRRGGHGFMNLSHLSCNGSETVLFTNYYIEHDYMINHAVQSNGHGYFSFCHPKDLESNVVYCIQYISKDQEMINTAFRLETGSQLLKVFNERKGGILVVYYNNDQIHVKGVYTDWRNTRNARLTKLKLEDDDAFEEGKRLSINHFETDTEHCFYFGFGQRRQLKTESKYFNKCLNKTDTNW